MHASATARVAAVLEGAPRAVRELGRSSSTVWYEVAPARVVVLQGAGPVRLPCALVTAQPVVLDGEVTVGDGTLAGASTDIRVSRTVSLRVPELPPPSAGRVRQACQVVDPADPDLALLGSGPGLTPYADDVIAGHLAAARAWRLDVDGLARGARTAAPTRTTALSATLLAAAADGEVVAPVTALLRALSTDGADVRAAVDRLCEVGASSGRGMAAGVLSAAVRVARAVTA